MSCEDSHLMNFTFEGNPIDAQISEMVRDHAPIDAQIIGGNDALYTVLTMK